MTTLRSASATAKSAARAGQIDNAVVVCGNLIERFDHERRPGAGPGRPGAPEQTLQLMRRFVAATPVDAAGFQAALVHAYAEALGSGRCPGAEPGRGQDRRRA